MVKGKLVSGDKMFVVRIDHYVKARDFAKHLAEHFYRNEQDFNPLLSKMDAEKILKRGLFKYGLEGEIDESLYEGSFEFGETFNPIYKNALSWVKEKYPWYV